MNLEMLRIWRESKRTIIFVTHSIREAIFPRLALRGPMAWPARIADFFPIDLPTRERSR
jgi:NitT/TauT family transport system ATP-binding protein